MMELKHLLIPCFVLLSLSPTLHAEQSSALALSVGAFDVNKNDNSATEFGVEYRFAPIENAFNIIPVAGATATTDGGYWVYSGVRYDIEIGENWVLTPNLAACLYEDGGGKDLGHAVEFRSGVEFAYKIDNNSHLGLAIYHMSNATLGEDNPGEESVILSYSFAPNF